MGEELFGQVTDATGLPKDAIAGELERLLNAAGVGRTDMTLDDLRRILSEYVQDVLLAAKEDLAKTEPSK